MTAVIYVDLEAVLPVIDGEWHRVDLGRVPMPGEELTMLCGITATAEFENLVRRRDHPPRQCWNCDKVYRIRKGIAPPGSPPRPRGRP